MFCASEKINGLAMVVHCATSTWLAAISNYGESSEPGPYDILMSHEVDSFLLASVCFQCSSYAEPNCCKLEL